MRTFTVAVGLIGVLASQAAMAQETAPSGSPPPAVAAPGNETNGPRPFGAAAGPAGPSVWGVLPWCGSKAA